MKKVVLVSGSKKLIFRKSLMQKNILVVDDDKDIVALMKYNLEKQGYVVDYTYNGADALVRAQKKPDLIILDVMLPDIDGWEVARRLKQDGGTSHLPIVFATAKHSEFDEVVGLELGAVDYIKKPISMVSFIARVRAALRRSNGTSMKDEQSADVFHVRGLMIDIPNFSVRIGSREVLLAKKEFELLACLVHHRDQVLSRQVLLDSVWGKGVSVYARTLDVHIRKIREKLGEYGAFITTMNRVGYKFSTHSEGTPVGETEKHP